MFARKIGSGRQLPQELLMLSWPIATYVLLGVLIATHVVFTFWVLLFGWFDLLFLLRALKQARVNVTDDGRVDHPPLQH